ncbi:putative Ganglioside-induced differentiation-associated protein 1 [Hypsibius exemplaris]|uniref:Ganglioside-induced differentiation-associated protein 1 n=1 Tax=Hypsibius exemplaris TaxID=2072580 RepID=A0A1W0X0H5_HYPEX|nr:putative Ganglioside-induced differentiation-associated protein 1 [Hypsibius exemplaris]
MASGDQEVTLYTSVGSYWSQMVRLALAEKDVAHKTVEVDIMNYKHYDPEYVAINPACEVPALSHKGKNICGSQEIIDYVDQLKGLKKHDEAEKLRQKLVKLPIPEITIGVARHARNIEEVQGAKEIENILSALFERQATLKERLAKYPKLSSAYHGKLKQVMDFEGRVKTVKEVRKYLGDISSFLDKVIEPMLAKGTGGDWLFGSDFTNADIVLAALLARISFLGLAEYYWGGETDKRPNVKAYFNRLCDRSSFKQECVITVPKP